MKITIRLHKKRTEATFPFSTTPEAVNRILPIYAGVMAGISGEPVQIRVINCTRTKKRRK